MKIGYLRQVGGDHHDNVKPVSDCRFLEQSVEQTVMIVVANQLWQQLTRCIKAYCAMTKGK